MENEGEEAPGEAVFNRTETVLGLLLATARLGLPALFRSPTGTVQGVAYPVVKSVLALNVITGCALAAAAKQIIKSKDKFFRTPSEKNQNEILPYSHKLTLGEALNSGKILRVTLTYTFLRRCRFKS